MAQVPFQFGALDEFSRRAVSQQMAFQQMASAANGYLAQLQAANEADTAPKVDLPEMRGANLTQGLGAILQNIVDPGAAERFAAQEAQVRQFNAQVQAQEALQNQVQEGYLQRRRQERQELMAKLSADTEATKARLEASLRELGIERDVQTAKAKADAIGKQREQDLLMNSKWLAEHGASFQQALAMARLGVNAMGQPLSEDERELAKGDLARIASSAPPGELRDQLMRDIAALDAFDEERKRLAAINAPGPIAQAGQSRIGLGDRVLNKLEGQDPDTFELARDIQDIFSNLGIGGLVSTEPLTADVQQGLMRAGSVTPEDAEFLRRVSTTAPTDPGFLFNQRERLPDLLNPKTPLGSSAKAFNQLMESFWGLDASVREGRSKVIQAVKQEAPTRR